MAMINHQDFSKHIMMMKKYTLLYLLCFSSFCWAQKKNLKQANKLFANKAYIEAAEIYKDLPSNKEILQKLGDCYYYNSQMPQAAMEYSNLLKNYPDSLNPKVHFRYAHALLGIKDYSNADKIMSEYLGDERNTEDFINNLQKIVPYNYEVKEVNTGSKDGDFGLSYLGEHVVFASLRNIENPKYKWNDKPYLDLYKASVSDDKNLENILAFSKKFYNYIY